MSEAGISLHAERSCKVHSQHRCGRSSNGELWRWLAQSVERCEGQWDVHPCGLGFPGFTALAPALFASPCRSPSFACPCRSPPFACPCRSPPFACPPLPHCLPNPLALHATIPGPSVVCSSPPLRSGQWTGNLKRDNRSKQSQARPFVFPACPPALPFILCLPPHCRSQAMDRPADALAELQHLAHLSPGEPSVYLQMGK